MDLELADKVAIVTGSSRGLGFAIAAALVEEGCRVTICARGKDRLIEARRELIELATSAREQAGSELAGPVLAIEADVASDGGVRLIIDQTVDTFGGFDIIVNKVGL